MRKKKLIFITILILGVSYLAYTFNSQKNKCSITLNGQKFNVSVAQTVAERAQGLSGTKNLAPNEGKLFVFDEPGMHGFWMKDMNYPIDIIWFDENWNVVGVAPDTAPDTYPRAFYPQNFSIYVLEVNAGWSKNLGLDFSSRAEASCQSVLK